VKYHIADGDQQRGPYTVEELWRVDFAPDTLVWTEGMSDWERADSIPDLRIVLAGKVPPVEADPEAPRKPTDDTPAEPEEFEVKIPAEVRRAEPVTVYPGAPAAQPYSPYGSAQPGIQYASGGYGPRGPLPIAAAVTSLVLGILALMLSFFALCLWVFSGPLAITAIVFGHVARHNAARGTAGGPGIALAGLICAYFALALTAFFMIGFFGIVSGP
jgi:hypothetical protein